MKIKTSKQSNQSKRTLRLKDMKPKKDAKGGRRNLLTTLSMDVSKP